MNLIHFKDGPLTVLSHFNTIYFIILKLLVIILADEHMMKRLCLVNRNVFYNSLNSVFTKCGDAKLFLTKIMLTNSTIVLVAKFKKKNFQSICLYN